MKKTPKKVKKKVLPVRFDEDEYKELAQKSKMMNMSLSAFVRKNSIRASVNYAMTDDDRKFLTQIIRMGNLFNQFAKIAERSGYHAVIVDLDNTRDELKNLIKKYNHD